MRALPIAERINDGVLIAKIVGNLGLVWLYRGDAVRSESHLTREIELAHRLGNRTDELAALLNLGLAKYMQGREADAMAVTDKAGALAVSMRIPLGEALARVNLAYVHIVAGRLEAADRDLDRVDAIRKTLGSPQVDQLAETIRAYLHVRTGDLGAAERALAAAERFGPTKNGHAVRARLLYEQRDYRGAREAIRKAQALRDLWMPTDQRLLEAIEDSAISGKPSGRAFESPVQ
jgi:tetratricopeptide (TPR) repeat protein